MRLVKFIFSVSHAQADEAAPRVASGRTADIGHEDGGTASKGGEQHDTTRNLDASDAVATRRRLCDYSVVPLTASECPSSFDADLNCNDADCGQLCEGDGECGTTQNANNCDGLGPGDYDMYRKVCKYCGYEVVALRSDDCPSTSDLPPSGPYRQCNGAEIQCGETCEGDNECGTSNDLNNCGGHDMYWKHCADCEYAVVAVGVVHSVRTSGTYSKTGTTCDGKPVYKCDTCSEDRYIKYVLNPHTRWIVDSASVCGEEKEPYMVSGSTFWPDPTYVKASAASSWGAWRLDEGSYSWAGNKVQCATNTPGQRWDVSGQGSAVDCEAGTYSSGEGATTCTDCSPGKISSNGAGACSPCNAGQESNDAHTICVSCPDGYYSSSAGTMCTACPAGETSNSGHTACEDCEPGYVSGVGGTCTPCAAGAVSNSAHTECENCGPGTYSNPDQSECMNCGDAGYANYDQTLWDQAQTNLASEDECKCATSRTGVNCDQEMCATTTPAISLGFLLLEVQWPRHARRLSRNEAFSGISAAFRAFDANGDNRLSLGEARAGIADGLMGVPLSVSHIWSRGDKKLYESDVTITEMIQDELGRLDTQQTKELYEQPSGSGEITAMEATYPNPLTKDKQCKDQNEAPPKLTWTVARSNNVIFQQCAFLNGEALAGDEGLNNDVSDGKSEDTDCRGSDGAQECSYNFELENYAVKSFLRAFDLEESDQRANCDVVELPNDSEECPFGTLSECTVALCGELCKGDGTCGGNDLNNCDTNSVYRKTCDSESETLTISKHSYCVQTKFCPSGTTDCNAEAADPKLTVTRCTTGLQYDGTPMDVFPRMLGTQGVSISWLDTRYDDTSGYRVYKYDASVPFAEDTSARLLKEIAVKKADCGLTHDYLDFRDTTTGSEPALEVGYAIVPLDGAGDELTDYVGVSGYNFAPSSSERRRRLQDTNAGGGGNGFIVTWFADIRVKVEAEGGGPVEKVTVKVTRLMPDGTGDDPSYTNFLTDNTNEFGEATLEIRVQDRSWFSKTQHFRVEVEKLTEKKQTATSYVQDHPLRVSGYTGYTGSPDVNGDYFPILDSSNNIDTSCNGMPRYECRDCGGYLWRATGWRATGRVHWIIYDQSTCVTTAILPVAIATLTGSPTDPTFGTWTSSVKVVALMDHVFSPASEVMAVRHLGEATFEFTDTTSVVISGTVSHAGFHAAYFAEGCPHTKFQYLADSFAVSGSTNQAQDGTYQRNGMCESLPYYECETCGSDQYIWYHPSDQRWHIGSGGCGSASAEIRVDDPDQDLEAVSAGSWEEWDGSTFGSSPVSVTVTIGSSYTKVDTEECICPVDGVEVWIKRESGPKKVTVNEGKFSTAVFEGEVVTLYLKGYYGVTGSSDCDGAAAAKDQFPDDENLGNLHCIEFTDVHGVAQLADVLEVKTDTDGDGTCSCPEGYEIWVPRSYEHANAVYTDTNVPDTFKVGWTAPTSSTFTYVPNAQCYNYLCSRAGLHQFSVTQESGTQVASSDMQQGVWPSFHYTATEDAEVHFLDTSMQTLSSKLVAGAGGDTATYVSGVPIVASVERCGWELPAWTLRGVANVELGAAKFDVRVLGADEVDEAKYYYMPGTLSNPDQELVVHDCDGDSGGLTPRDDMVGTLFVTDASGAQSTEKIMLRGCRAKLPEVSGTDRLPCATTKYTYVDELPQTRKFEKDLSDLTAAPAPVNFEITSPLCLEEVKISATDPQPRGGNGLQSLLTHDGNREYALAADEKLLLLSELPDPQEEGLYGTACTTNTGAVFREGDAVELEFKLVEREPDCGAANFYPWDACSFNDNAPTTSHDIKIRVADGVSGEEYGETCPSADPNDTCLASSYGTDLSFTHTMTVGAPNPFAPFSHELSVEFTRAYDDAEILFVRHVLVLGSIPEEVPQVWTVATNPTLIFSIIRDPPGGASTATLVEGSTISTSMAIDGSHAAQLEDSLQGGASVGVTFSVSSSWMLLKHIASGGIRGGVGYATTPVDISVSRSTSRNFDIGISFGVGISTSDSPYIAGQPSDVIIGGGANLRFISAIEIYAKVDSVNGGLCLGGLTAMEFLPEQISTWVMSVYEIEKTIERIGAALTDPNTKWEAKEGVPNPHTDLPKQIANWQTVLANYRAATIRDQAESVAEQLSRELNNVQAHFQTFLSEAEKGGDDNRQFSNFLSHGLNKLEHGTLMIDYHRSHDNLKLPKAGEIEGIADTAEVNGRGRLELYENDVLDRVNNAYAECVDKVALVEPNGEARLCDVYRDIHANLELKESLFGICDFAKKGDCCDAGADGAKCDEDKDELCTCCDASLRTCKKEEVTCTTLSAVQSFCKEGPYRTGRTGDENMISAFDALSNTEHYVTFSGTTGIELSWDVSQSRGQAFSSTHAGAVKSAVSASFALGFNTGRRRLETTDKGVPGYAFPTSGRVLAVSKKLLEVTPEALERRRLDLVQEGEQNLNNKNFITGLAAVLKGQAEMKDSLNPASNPCRRRLDGTKLSDEERRRLGATGCAKIDGGTAASFSVSLGRAATKETGQSHAIAVSLKDDNAQDVFAVRISQDTVYGTPIFTTMGGRSSCVGETGTTRRDSRVTIKEIKHLCSKNDPATSYPDSPLCASSFDCECNNLAPGEDAFFSVVLQNLSPWKTSVKYLLRATKGGSSPWNSAKVVGSTCPDGDMGALVIEPVSLVNLNLRDGEGMIIAPLDYGQHEVHLKITRDSNLAPQCYAYKDIEFELVSICEDTDWDSNQGMYQYRAHMDHDTGAVSVVHPKFVGRPVGDDCADSVTLDADSTSVTGTTHYNDGKWCYSDVNRAMGCTASPADCWSACDRESKACGTVYVSGILKSTGTYAKTLEPECDGKPVYKCEECDEDRYLRYYSNLWYITGKKECTENPTLAYDVDDAAVYTDGPKQDLVYASSGDPDLVDPTTGKSYWWHHEEQHLDSTAAKEESACESSTEKCYEMKRERDWNIKVWCELGEESFDLQAIDWEEVTGQCRCQNGCECTVEDLVTYDVTKPETHEDYETRQTTTHLLTKDVSFPPRDEAGAEKTCGLYTFTDASKANGPDTSTATFDVSWEVYGCRYEDAANFNPLATKDDGSCMFRITGCTYAAAGNYNPDATEDDGSCVFGSQFAPRDVSGGSCMAGVDDPDALVSLYQYMIAKLAGVDPSDVKVDVTEVSSCGGNGRRRLSGAFEFSYTITTNPALTDAVQATMAGVTAEDIDAELKNQAALQLNSTQAAKTLGGATTEGVQEVAATPDSSSGGGSSAGNNKLEADSAEGSGLAVGAILLLFLIVAAFYVYRWCEAQKAQKAEQDDRLREALRRATPGFRRQEERISCAAAEDANHDSNREDSESEGDLEKQPLRPDSGGLELRDMSKPTAYPGGQSLPPWPYPETRPTPASYDPACILRVSWPRDAARPTESFLRETFEALAPVRNVGLGSGNAAMVVFKDAAGMRAAEAAYDGPWRVAAAKPPAAAADQPPPPPPPPPPPKTGEV